MSKGLDVRLQHEVTHIDHSGEEVVVRTKDGQEFKGQKVSKDFPLKGIVRINLPVLPLHIAFSGCQLLLWMSRNSDNYCFVKFKLDDTFARNEFARGQIFNNKYFHHMELTITYNWQIDLNLNPYLCRIFAGLCLLFQSL